MKHAQLSFVRNLLPLLPPRLRGELVPVIFQGEQSIKHLIESLGVPHTEIGSLSIAGVGIGLDYIVQDGDHIIIEPFDPLQATNPLGMSRVPSAEIKFVLDNHLGKLASYLRMLGFDSLYQNDFQDDHLIALAVNSGRILLTRDRHLLMHKVIASGYLIRSKNPKEQLFEVIDRYQISAFTPFQRCLRCNGLLQEVSKEEILPRLELLTRRYFDQFCICPDCQQIYWRGSHYELMLALVEQVTKAVC